MLPIFDQTDLLLGYLVLRVYYWRGLLFVVVGVLACAGLARGLSPGRFRPAIVASCALLYLSLPIIYVWVGRGYADFRGQHERWIADKCKQTMAAGVTLPDAPIAVDGFLDRTNQDALMNERLRRSYDQERARSGSAGGASIDTGYERHPYTPLYDGAAFGSTFAGSARRVLTQWRFSYVEFEIIPRGFDGDYANAGDLKTDGWNGGVRYRRYYLAPPENDNCEEAVRLGKRTDPPGVIAMRGYTDGPYCLAIEISAEPISTHALKADEQSTTLWTTLHPRGLPVPAWASVRLDSLTVVERKTDKVVARYEGFDYPNQTTPKYRCNNPAAARKVLVDSLTPHPQRSFLQQTNWYAGSGVERYYESGATGEREVPRLKPPILPPGSMGSRDYSN